MNRMLIALAALAGSAALAAPASATEYIYGFSGDPWTLSINGTPHVSADTGWINSIGVHSAGNPNYITGDLSGTFYNNYVVFNLSRLGAIGTITSLRLTLNTATAFLPNGPRRYSLYHVLASAASLYADRAGGDPMGIALYDDLGDGAVYGGQSFTGLVPPDNGLLTITLNAAAIAEAQSQLGHGNFILGGSLNLPGQAGLNAVPEPAAWALMIAGFGLIGGAMRRHSSFRQNCAKMRQGVFL